jgi:uncharacterized membrane protein
MSRAWHKPAILLMWLALPAAAWLYWRVWDQLPARMAVHFDATWRPNGYTSREGAVQLGLEILVVMLVLFTITTLMIDALKPAAFWAALVISYAVLGFCWYGNYSIVEFNLKAHSEHSEWLFGERNSRSSSAGSHASRWLHPSVVLPEN